MMDELAAPTDDMPFEKLQEWVGRVQTTQDVAAPAALEGLAALLDHENPPWVHGEIPPLSHWLYFLKHERQSSLDKDGHPKRGDFLPPVPLPRRMWAGSRIEFLTPIRKHDEMTRRSTIAAVTAKQGRSGSIVFVKVRHEVSVGRSIAVVEDQDIVYRSAPTPGAAVPAPIKASRHSEHTRSITPGPVSLFRFSALTLNAHRIHYDRDYARSVEGYPGLVVHGPWLATLLMDQFLRRAAGRRASAFTFRAERPVFDTAPFDVCLRMTATGAEAWVVDSEGASALSATIETA